MPRVRSAALRVANALSAAASLALILLIIAGPGPRATTPELAALTATCAATVLTGVLIRRDHTDHRTDHENGSNT